MKAETRKDVVRQLFVTFISLLLACCAGCGGSGSGGEGDVGLSEPGLELAAGDSSIAADLRVVESVRGRMTIAWEPVRGAARYKVYRSGNYLGSVVDTSFTDTGLIPHVTYVYQVKAQFSNGTEKASLPLAAVNKPWTRKLPGQINVIKQLGNHVYVGGSNTYRPDLGPYSWGAGAYLAKHDLSGNIAWEATFKNLAANPRYGSWVSDMAFSPAGDSVYVCGTVDFLSDEPRAQDGVYKYLHGNSFVAKFDISGSAPVQKWLNIVSAVPDNLSFGKKIAVDSDENVYVFSEIRFAVGFASNPNWDASVTSYDSNGCFRWAHEWNLTPPNGSQWGTHFYAHLLDIDFNGNLYVSGMLQGVKTYNGYFAEYNLEERKSNGDGGYAIYYINAFVRAKLNLNTGKPEWEVVQKTGWNPANSPVLDHSTGNMYQAMLDVDIWGEWPNRGLMMTDSSGKEAWTVGGIAKSCDYWSATLDNGSLYLGGHVINDTNQSWEPALAKYDVSGAAPRLVYNNTFAVPQAAQNEAGLVWALGVVKAATDTSLWGAVRSDLNVFDGLAKKSSDYYGWYLMRVDTQTQYWW